MARPIYNTNQKTARERIKDTFWGMLSEMEYRHITVKELSKRAAVNPNTFYYHYETMDDLAINSFEEDKLTEIPDIILKGIVSGSQIRLQDSIENMMLNDRRKRLRYFARGDSPFLRQHFIHTMEEYWLSIMGISKEELSDGERLDFEFILYGVVSMIGNHLDEQDFNYLNSFPDRALGQGIIQTLENLIKRDNGLVK